MKKREEKKYVDKVWADMKAFMIAYLKNEQPEDLHRFRVQVKKLRAFLILSDSAGLHPRLAGDFKPVKKIFKQAGAIRNAYMNLELGKRYQTNDADFICRQQELMRKTRIEFKSKGRKYLKEMKAAYREIREKINPVSDLHIQLFYQNQLQQIAAAVEWHRFDGRLHECRKRVKILIYNYKLSKKVPGLTFNETYLEQVQTAIGDWHDNLLASQLFSADQPVSDSFEKQNKKIENNISALVKDFYNQATTSVESPLEQLS